MAYPGLFYDGESAHAQPVEVTFNASALVVARARRVLVRWRYRKLFLLTPGEHPGLRIGAHGAGEARLVLENEAAVAELKRRAPGLFPKRGARTLIRRAAIFAGVSAGLLVAAYVALPYLAEALTPLVPISIEQQIGSQIHQAFDTRYGTCTGEREKTALAILDRLTQRILGTTETPFAIKVEVTRMKLENAFALPGGVVVVTRGLIAVMKSPDELAGVLAHELGHVVERHAMIGIVESTGLSLAGTLITGGGSSSGEWVVSAASTLASLSYSRRLESRADARGITMLEAAGISPLGLATLFARLEQRKGKKKQEAGATSDKENGQNSEDSLSVFLSSHPPSALRIARARQSALVNAPPALSAEEWSVVKTVCAEESAPRQARSGSTQSKPPEEGAPAPSQTH